MQGSGLVAFALLFGVPASVSAREPPAEQRYGLDVGLAHAVPLSVAAASVGLSVLDVRSDAGPHGEPLLYGIFAVPVGMISAPVVHWAHGNVLGGVASFAGTATSAGVGGTLGGLIGSGCRQDRTRCTLHGVLLGVAITQGFWAVIDADGLARAPRARSERGVSGAWSPRAWRVGLTLPDEGRRGAMLSFGAEL